jgi:lysyl-tRNA synthetase class 2
LVIFATEKIGMHELSEQELVRREKLAKLRELGIDPYPAEAFTTTHYAKDIAEKFEENATALLAGRLMSRRVQGKASFAELQDATGRVQLYFNRDVLCPEEDKSLYNDVYKRLLDIGDIIGVEGRLFTTQVGEKTVEVHKLFVLSKSLRPLPLPKVDAEGNTYDAFTDPEQRYRMRYVDLIVNPQVKDAFVKRTKITNTMRSFFNNRGDLEVENAHFTTHSRRCGGTSICYASQCAEHPVVFTHRQRIVLKTSHCRWI